MFSKLCFAFENEVGNVEDFSIENIRIVESHGWGISLEECAYGRVKKIDFDACMSKVIDGKRAGMKTLSVHGATGADISVEDLSENIFAILNK